MNGPTPRRLWKYVTQCLRLGAYFQAPGDGRLHVQIPAKVFVWSLLIGHVLREYAFHGIEALVRSSARAALGVSRTFGDDALAYFTERLDPAPTRCALASALRYVKRNKAFAKSAGIGLAIDGTTAGRCAKPQCPLCWPLWSPASEIVGYSHHLVMASVVGVGLSLPCDVEPIWPGESERPAGQRLLDRVVRTLGGRFADYVVADAEFATAPFLHTARERGLYAVVRLKENLPELYQTVHDRFDGHLPHGTFVEGADVIEVWDAEDFDSWDALRWDRVRVLRYRQRKRTGDVVEAYWLTDFPQHLVDSRTLYRMAKSRWEIENQGFNDAKSRHGLDHLCHHQANSVVISWLLIFFALVIERLYRLRYLHRGMHQVRSAIELVRLLRLSLAGPPTPDTS